MHRLPYSHQSLLQAVRDEETDEEATQNEQRKAQKPSSAADPAATPTNPHAQTPPTPLYVFIKK